MTTAIGGLASTTTPDPPTTSLVRTARTTGVLYLAVAVTGGLGFLLIRPLLFDAGDPAATVGNLVEGEHLARLGIALAMALVVLQALTALWFWRLFRTVSGFAAAAIAVFGLLNAFAVFVRAAFLATALDVARTPLGDAASNAQLMYLVTENVWTIANIAFGLWLIPMGWCVLRSRWMPRPLGWILVAGGVGYLLSAFVHYIAPDAGVLAGVLPVPAHAGEFWMMGYLLLRGIRRSPGGRE